MHEVAGAWLMTSLAPTPILVALMRTASSLRFFLLAFSAGALAEVVDRRRVLLATKLWMMAAAAALGRPSARSKRREKDSSPRGLPLGL